MLIDAPIAYVPSEVDDVNAVTVGARPSITIADEPAMLLEPLGTVVEVMVLPTASRTVPIVNDETVRSDEVCDAPTV
jgi:hypothetical protein